MKKRAEQASWRMHRLSIGVTLGLAMSWAHAQAPSSGTAQALEPAALLTLTNLVRSAAHTCGEQGKFDAAAALVWDERLTRIAAFIARDNAERNELSHLDKYGRGLVERARPYARLYRAGENLAHSPDLSARGVASVVKGEGLFNPVDGWLQSPGHCSNLMSPIFRRMGAAYALDNKGGIYWAQIFSD